MIRAAIIGGDGPEQQLWLLIEAIDDETTLEFAVEYASERDPVPGWWAACSDDRPMRQMVSRLRLDGRTFCDACLARMGRPPRTTCDDCVAAIRRLVPELTLARVLSAAKEGP